MKVSDIDVSLTYGKYFSGKWLILLYFGLITNFTIPCSAILIAIIYLILKIPLTEELFIIPFLCCSILFLLFSFYFLCLILNNRKLRKNIELWIEDSIQVRAWAKLLDKFRVFGQPIAEVKIEVSFLINKRRFVKESGDGKKRNRIYQKALAKYADREITILYSPKYDQVLILRDDK